MYNPNQNQPRARNENCKIKIKNTSQGKTLEFSGNCTREQLAIAKESLMDKPMKSSPEED